MKRNLSYHSILEILKSQQGENFLESFIDINNNQVKEIIIQIKLIEFSICVRNNKLSEIKECQQKSIAAYIHAKYMEDAVNLPEWLLIKFTTKT